MNHDKAVSETEGFEGFRSNPYKDSRGIWTFGIGRCLETSPLTGEELKYLLDSGLIALSITHLGAQHLLDTRVTAVDIALAAHWVPYGSMPDEVQTILVEMAYQLGVASLLTFNTFLGLLAAKRYDEAAADGRTTAWYKQTPVRAESLMKRLEAV
jgi:lysozyme